MLGHSPEALHLYIIYIYMHIGVTVANTCHFTSNVMQHLGSFIIRILLEAALS